MAGTHLNHLAKIIQIRKTIQMNGHNIHFHGVQSRMISGPFFCIFKIIIFCFVVATCDLVHNVETIFHLSYVLTASENLF